MWLVCGQCVADVFLQKTRIATRKWILGEAGMAEDDAGGWGQLEQD